RRDDAEREHVNAKPTAPRDQPGQGVRRIVTNPKEPHDGSRDPLFAGMTEQERANLERIVADAPPLARPAEPWPGIVTPFSYTHPRGAIAQRERVAELEAAGLESAEKNAAVVLCVVSCASALEAFINEAFALVAEPEVFGHEARDLDPTIQGC